MHMSGSREGDIHLRVDFLRRLFEGQLFWPPIILATGHFSDRSCWPPVILVPFILPYFHFGAMAR